MNQLQQIKEIIIKSNRDIVKLQFGCKVKWRKTGQDCVGVIAYNYSQKVDIYRNSKGLIIYKNGATYEDNTNLVVYEDGSSVHNNIGIIDHQVEIIGRSIRLADVLLANRKNSVKDQNINNVLKLVLELWNLKDDNLDNQDKPTQKYILDLLV